MNNKSNPIIHRARIAHMTGQVAGRCTLMMVVGAMLLTSACGTPPPQAAPSVNAVQASEAVQVVAATDAEVTPPTQPPKIISLHDRVMAEQGRGNGAVHVDRLVTTTTIPTLEVSTTTIEAGSDAALVAAGDPPADPNATTNVVFTGGQTPLTGVWSGTAERLASYLLAICPTPRFTVDTATLAGYYVHYCAEAGLRADLLWAQMIHETGYGMYGGDVSPEQNNYAGIGATGGGAPGLSFATAEAGVMAQVAHMVAYVYPSSPVEWANVATDPRYDFVNPRGVARVLADLNGRWAVPGTTYGHRIEDLAREINAY